MCVIFHFFFLARRRTFVSTCAMNKQQIVTYKLSSCDRDTVAWPSTNTYCMEIPETLGGVRQISLSGVDAPFLQRTLECPGEAFLYREGLVLDAPARLDVTFEDVTRGSHTVTFPPSHQMVTLTPKEGTQYWVNWDDTESAVHDLSVHACPSQLLLLACHAATGRMITYPIVALGKTEGKLHVSLPDTCESVSASSVVLRTKPLMLTNVIHVMRVALPSVSVTMDAGRLRLDADAPFSLRMDDALFRALGWSCPSRVSHTFRTTHEADTTPWGNLCHVRPSNVYGVDKWRALVRHSMNLLYFKTRPHFVMGIHDGSMHMVTLPCGHFGCIDNLLDVLCESMRLSIKNYTCTCADQTFECCIDKEGRVSLTSNLPYALHFAEATATAQLIEALHFDRLNYSGKCVYASTRSFDVRHRTCCPESHLEYAVLEEDTCQTASGISLTSKHIIYGSGSPVAECGSPASGPADLITDFNNKKVSNYAYWYVDGTQYKIVSDCFLTCRTGVMMHFKQLGGSCTYAAEVTSVVVECGGVVMSIDLLCEDGLALPVGLNSTTAVAIFMWWPDMDALFDLPFAHQTDRSMPVRMGFGYCDYLCQSHYVSPSAWTPRISHSILLHIDTLDGQTGRWKMVVGENGIVPYTSTFRSPGSDMQSVTYQESVVMYLSGATINRLKVAFTNMDGTPYNFHGRDNVVTLAFVY